MGFLNPGLLAVLGFLAVPIIIQFFVNRRRIVIHWAAYEWMRKALQQQKKNVRINDWLKLLAKLLLVLLLVLFASRPATTLSGKSRKLIIIDNSLSMGARFAEGNRLDIAKEIAEALLRQADGPLAVYSFDGALTPLARLQERHASPGAVLAQLQISSQSGHPRKLISELLADPVLQEVDAITFISDFQVSFYGDGELSLELLNRLGRKKSLVFVPVDRRVGLNNVAVTSVEVPPEGCYPGHDNELLVKVRNFGSQDLRSLPVSLAVDGQKQDRTLVNLRAGDEAELRLRMFLQEARRARITVEVPPDDYAADNRFNLVFDPGRELRALLIAPSPAREGVYSPDLFVEAALYSFCDRSYLKCRRIRPLGVFEENLSVYDLILTFGVRLDDNDGVGRRLLTELRRGTGFLSFTDPSAADPWPALGLKPDHRIDSELVVDADRLGGTGLGFMADEELDPTLIGFYRGLTISGINDSGAGGRLFVKGLDSALAAERQLDDGRAMVFGFLPAPGETNFFYNPNFVQFMMRSVTSVLPDGRLQVYTGEELGLIPLPDADPGATYSLRGAGGIDRKLELRGMGKNAELISPILPDSGFFSLLRDNDVVREFAYNVTRGDSAIEPMAEGEFAKLRDAGLQVNPEPQNERQKTRKEYYAVMLALLLLALAFENYAHFIRPRRASGSVQDQAGGVS